MISLAYYLQKQFKQAQTKIQKGLGKFPNQFNLLIIANDVHRASGDRSKSLEYAELLITHHFSYRSLPAV